MYDCRLKLACCPARSPLPIAALPSVSPIPSVRLPILGGVRRFYFLDYFGGSSRTNDQETSAVSPVSYSTLKCERNFFGTLTRTGTAPGEILFAFLMALCGSRNERPSSNSTSNASPHARYFAPVTCTIFAVPNGTLSGCNVIRGLLRSLFYHSARRPELIEAFGSQYALCAQRDQTLAAPAPQTLAVSLQRSFFDRSS
jgi:hypothetical protein